MCGDLNACCSDLHDVISGVDQTGGRDVVDFTLNNYDSLLCDFLNDSNCCILNGRNFIEYSYTFIGPQGVSVVDYCLVPYEHLGMFDSFKVTSISGLYNTLDISDRIQHSTGKPDHSILSWNFHLNTYRSANNEVFNGRLHDD